MDSGKKPLEVLGSIGKGGQASVFLGKLHSGRGEAFVTVKAFVNPSVCDHEFDFWAKIFHPLIPRFYGRISGWTHAALVGEFIYGSTLAILLDVWSRSAFKLSHAVALYLAHEMLEVLSYLESRGMVHGDLAAENILVCPAASIKLCDFGASMWAGDVAPRSAAIGRRDFVAPEILQGEAPTHWSDLYGLATILYELVTQDRFRPDDASRCRYELKLQLGAHMPSLYYLIHSCLQASPLHRPSCAVLARSRLSTLSDVQISRARQDLICKLPAFNLQALASSGTFVDFFPTACF